MNSNLSQVALQSGIVGAGGAGFPTHVKLEAQAEFLLINGAECEPLLHKDKELLKLDAPTVIRGALLAAEAIGAKRIICGIKAKYRDVVSAVERAIDGTGVELKLLGNYYPSGDEYNLTYECTGRLIPPAGIPIAVGCVVNNVETFFNIARAADHGETVVDSYLTIAGKVSEPVSVRVPVGTSIRDLLELTGFESDDITVLDGGAMMGHLREDLSYPVAKTSGGFIVLPNDHYLVRRRRMTKPQMHRKGHSACDQCTYCTEFCPRFLLGYEVEPHKVMRSLLFAGQKPEEYWSRWGQLCCECNLCSLYACPEDLDPKDACVWSKQVFRERKPDPPEWTTPQHPHPMEDHRKVPLEKLTRRLGLEPYDRPAPWSDIAIEPERVRIPLKQHTGEPCTPTVEIGDHVARGQLIGDIPSGTLGAPIHASIDGRVSAINGVIEITRS